MLRASSMGRCIGKLPVVNILPKVNTQTDNLAKRTRTVAENG